MGQESIKATVTMKCLSILALALTITLTLPTTTLATTTPINLCDVQHEFKYKDEDIDFKTYNTHENYDVDTAVEALTTGDGYAIIKNAISQEDVEILKERVMYYTR